MDKSGDELGPQYRLYHLDGAGLVTTAGWLDADGDRAAIDASRNDNISVQSELWQGRRLVTRLAHGEAIAPIRTPPDAVHSSSQIGAAFRA